MAQDQTIFSELCVALSIANTDKVLQIKGTQECDVTIYNRELRKRENRIISIESLQLAGQAIRSYLMQEGIMIKEVVWTGKENVGAMVAVAKDIEVANWRVSIKENANVFINGSPITVFEDIPSGTFGQKRKGNDWFLEMARSELQNYYSICTQQANITNCLEDIEEYYKLTKKPARRSFSKIVAELHKNKRPEVIAAYQSLCDKVSDSSAKRFNENILNYKGNNRSQNALHAAFHYFFKINGVKYILAGTQNNNPFAVILQSSSEWIREYILLNIKASPKKAGQPEVLLSFMFKNKKTSLEFTIDLKVEIRWSHGKFCGNPEAKIYKTWSYEDLPWSLNLFKKAF